jgi:WD40 repeat protein
MEGDMQRLLIRAGLAVVIAWLLFPISAANSKENPAEDPPKDLAKQAKDEPAAKPVEQADALRIWETADGKIRIEAQFVEVVKGFVSLRKADGKIVKLSLAKLRAEDKAFVAKIPKPKIVTLASAMFDLEREEKDTYLGFLMFAPDSGLLYVWGGSGEVYCYDVAARKRIGKIQLDGDIVGGVTFAPDGKHLVTTVQRKPFNYELASWELATGKLVRSLGSPKHFPSLVAFSDDGKTVITSEGEFVELIDWATGKPRGRYNIRGPAEVGRMYEMLSDGKTLLIGSGLPEIENIHAWDAATGRKLSTITPGHTRMYYFTASNDRSLIATGGNHDKDAPQRFAPKILFPGELFVWDARRGARLRTLRGHRAGVAGMAFSPDSKRLAVTFGDMTIAEWDVRSGKMVGRHEVRTSMPGESGGYMIPIRVAYAPDGATLVAACGTHLRFWTGRGENGGVDGPRRDTDAPALDKK